MLIKLLDSRQVNDGINRIERRLGRAVVFSSPVEVTVEPTNACNSKCLMCLPYRRDDSVPHAPTGYLEPDTLEALAPVLRRARRVLLGGFGEPLMHPEYPRLLRRAKELVPFVYAFTNALNITPELADQIVSLGMDSLAISMGGCTSSTFKTVRGVELDAVLNGLENLASAKRRLQSPTPRIAFNVVQMRSVIPEIDGIVDLARQYGVSQIDLPQMWVESRDALSEGIIGDTDALASLEESRARADSMGVGFSISDNPPVDHACRYAWSNMFMSWDGELFSCPSERYRLGKVSQIDVLDTWRRGSFAELRRRLRRDANALCPYCPVIDAASYQNPAIHGRIVSEELRSGSGPARVHSRRICDEGQ